MKKPISEWMTPRQKRLIISAAVVCMLCVVNILVACSSSQSQQSTSASVSSGLANSSMSDSNKQDAVSDGVQNSEAVSQLKPLSGENAIVGNHVGFGKYEQDGNTNNGSEEIAWRVLAVEDGRALLISEYGLDSHKFDNKSGNWENSDLRNWLNTSFMDSAFLSDERGRIDGEVFCLSVDEAESLFSSNEERLCVPTKHAIQRGVESDKSGKCSWWLRTHGTDGNPIDGDVAVIVATSGKVFLEGQFVSSVRTAIRPVIWIRL